MSSHRGVLQKIEAELRSHAEAVSGTMIRLWISTRKMAMTSGPRLPPELDEDGIAKHQSLIGSLQWAVSLGRLDITTAVMTMSGFRTNPREMAQHSNLDHNFC